MLAKRSSEITRNVLSYWGLWRSDELGAGNTAQVFWNVLEIFSKVTNDRTGGNRLRLCQGCSGWTGGGIPSWKEFKVPSHLNHSRIFLNPLVPVWGWSSSAGADSELTWAPPAPPNCRPNSSEQLFTLCPWLHPALGCPCAPGSAGGAAHSVHSDLQKGVEGAEQCCIWLFH